MKSQVLLPVWCNISGEAAGEIGDWSPLGLKGWTFSLPSLKSTFSQPFKDKCISDVVRIGSVIIFHLSKVWKAKFFMLCDVSGEAAGEIWNRSLLGVKAEAEKISHQSCEHHTPPNTTPKQRSRFNWRQLSNVSVSGNRRRHRPP